MQKYLKFTSLNEGIRSKRINKRKIWILLSIIIMVMVIMKFGLNESLTVSYYKVESNRIQNTIRIAFITDLHSCYYGEGQEDLLNCIYEQNPDVVLLGGDIVDDRLPSKNAAITLKALAEKYICYYVSGNHEYRSGKIDEIKKMISGYGVVILEGQRDTVNIKQQLINICGVDDADVGKSCFFQQIANTETQTDSAFTIFMAHRPEYIKTYLQYDFDLILAGHAHGGQWRIPGVINGLLAPNQGFFPKYAGGEYEFGDKTFIVSRGLARESTHIPRFFNPPEVVIVDIE